MKLQIISWSSLLNFYILYLLIKLRGKDLVVLFFCRQLQSVLLTTPPQQQPGGNATPAAAIQWEDSS